MLDQIAQEGKLTLGLVFPLEAYAGSVPQMKDQERLAKRAESQRPHASLGEDVSPGCPVPPRCEPGH